MKAIRTLVFVLLLISCYYFTYYIFLGISQPIPSLGDSWDYHIPISQSILNGTFLHPENFELSHWYPGSSEAINALLLLLHVPLTLSNIIAILVLGFSCYKLARTFNLKYEYAILFALTFLTLNVVVRWMNAVSIDVWVAVYFVWLIILLEKTQKTSWYFAKLGFFSGMLIGSKYSAVLFFLMLILFYGRKILSVLSIKHFFIFLIPFSFLGLFWYIRNYLFIQNPFYPLPVFGFEGKDTFGGLNIAIISIRYPVEMLNALFAEYKLWFLSIPLGFGILINKFFIKKKFQFNAIEKLFLLGLLNMIIFLRLPTSEQPWIMVSSFRYSYPVFIPLLLAIFLLGAKHKKEMWVGFLSVAGSLNVLSMAYYPKLLLFYLPLAGLLGYFFFRKRN